MANNGLGIFAGSFLNSFTAAQQNKERKDEREQELKARTQLFEIQMKRLQQEMEERKQQDAARREVFERLSGSASLSAAPGVSVEDPRGPAKLTDLLADPEGAMMLLRSGIISPQQLLPQQPQVPSQVALLQALRDDPELAKVDAARRTASAPSTTINLDSQGLTKPPPGFFRPNPKVPGLVPEPGGPVTIEQDATRRKDAARAESTTNKIGSVATEISDAMKLVNSITTGFAARMTAGVAGTPAYDLGQKLETIKANLGFDRLQEMREASPTGGALGSVAVKELEGLQAGVASLDQFQSPRQLKKNLQKIEGHYSRWEKAVKDAQAQQTSGEIDFSELPD